MFCGFAPCLLTNMKSADQLQVVGLNNLKKSSDLDLDL